MVVDVGYPHRFPYRHDGARDAPILVLAMMRTIGDEGPSVDVDAHLDSGATLSLFDGALAVTIGLDLLAGEATPFTSTTGQTINAYRHPVVLIHDELGTFSLRVGFSTAPIARNLLGRDFFNLVQIGFRERWQEIYIHPAP